jgi:DNA-binding MltR family transcriptional regulator
MGIATTGPAWQHQIFTMAEIQMDEEEQYQVVRSEFSNVVKALNKESDRGCALFAAAYLDAVLAKLLKSSLVQDSRVEDDLFRGQAPLSAFSARIKMAYYLRMINAEERKALDTIRSIRNHFAHHPNVAQFSDHPIRDKCANLFPQLMTSGLMRTARLQFIGAIAHLLGKIHGSLLESLKSKGAPDKPN